MSGAREARITIGGVDLSYAESLSVRVGINMAIAHYSERGACGADELGERIRLNYVHHLNRALQLIHQAAQREGAVSQPPPPPEAP